jgi:hypothetical protein
METDIKIENLEIGDTISVRWHNWMSAVRGFVCETYGQRYDGSKWITLWHGNPDNNNKNKTSVTPEYYPVELYSVRMVLVEKVENYIQPWDVL